MLMVFACFILDTTILPIVYGGVYTVPLTVVAVFLIGMLLGRMSGLLYGIVSGWEYEKAMQFGWATGAMAATVKEDYASPLDEEQVWSMYKGNARVKR